MSIWFYMPGWFVLEQILCGATPVNHLSLDPMEVMYCLSLPSEKIRQILITIFPRPSRLQKIHGQLVKTPRMIHQ